MLTELAPTTGADFLRLDLKTVRQGLETLAQAGAQAGGVLSPDQIYWFNRYLTAWDYYRNTQPQGYQDEVEEAIAVIFGYRISI